jgi:hypothetical protein
MRVPRYSGSGPFSFYACDDRPLCGSFLCDLSFVVSLVLSCLVLSCLVLSCLVLSCLVLSCLVLSRGCLVQWLSLILSCLAILSSFVRTSLQTNAQVNSTPARQDMKNDPRPDNHKTRQVKTRYTDPVQMHLSNVSDLVLSHLI